MVVVVPAPPAIQIDPFHVRVNAPVEVLNNDPPVPIVQVIPSGEEASIPVEVFAPAATQRSPFHTSF